MTLLQYFVLLVLAIVGIIGYVLVAAAANADREYEKDEHAKMIETRDEYRNDRR